VLFLEETLAENRLPRYRISLHWLERSSISTGVCSIETGRTDFHRLFWSRTEIGKELLALLWRGGRLLTEKTRLFTALFSNIKRKSLDKLLVARQRVELGRRAILISCFFLLFFIPIN